MMYTPIKKGIKGTAQLISSYGLAYLKDQSPETAERIIPLLSREQRLEAVNTLSQYKNPEEKLRALEKFGFAKPYRNVPTQQSDSSYFSSPNKQKLANILINGAYGNNLADKLKISNGELENRILGFVDNISTFRADRILKKKIGTYDGSAEDYITGKFAKQIASYNSNALKKSSMKYDAIPSMTDLSGTIAA